MSKKDRIIVVGGLSQGGAAVVERLYKESPELVVVGDRSDRGFEALREHTGKNIGFLKLVMGDRDSMNRFEEQVALEYGVKGYHHIVIISPPFSERGMEKTIQSYMTSPMVTIDKMSELCCFDASITYVAPKHPRRSSVGYQTTEASMNGYMAAAAKNFARVGIRINMLVPGRFSSLEDIADGVHILAYRLNSVGESITVGSTRLTDDE